MEKPSWHWRLYTFLANLNLAIFYLEIVYDAIANRSDRAKLLTYACFFCLLTFGCSFKIVLKIYLDDIVKSIMWCESRHQIRDGRVFYHSRNIFEEACELSVNGFKRRVNGTLSVFTSAFVIGGIVASVTSGEYATVMGVYSPLYDIDNLVKFIFNTVHHWWAIFFPLIGGLSFGTIFMLIFRYLHGQFELTVDLTKELGAMIKKDVDQFDEELLRKIVDLYNEGNE